MIGSGSLDWILDSGTVMNGSVSGQNNRKAFILTFNPHHTNTGGMLLHLLQ